jgi:hypothetical protein
MLRVLPVMEANGELVNVCWPGLQSQLCRNAADEFRGG